MKYLKIQNDGELDIRLVALMGGTTKADDRYKIGQFGIGLKYTLAFLFRNNLAFKIFIGEEEVKIHLEYEDIKGERFEIICINGQRTSITTRMGEDWDAWMIIRELWCNALDEGGAAKEITDVFAPAAGKTIFYIQLDKQISEVLSRWDKYFIHNQQALYSDGTYSIYPASEKLRIYKQGVLIYEHPSKKGVFSYDFAAADINELREFKGSPACVIAHSLHNANKKVATYFLENVSEDHFEGEMDYDWYLPKWSRAWANVIGTGKLIYQKVVDDAKARGIEIDEANLIVVPKQVYLALTKQFDGIGALRVASKVGEFYETFNEKMESKIKQCLTILEHCEYVMHPELKFAYGFFEDKTILAKVCFDQKTVYVSNTLLQGPLFQTVGMLIEENEHYNTGLSDHTREFQQHFINLFTRTLLAKNEVEI